MGVYQYLVFTTEFMEDLTHLSMADQRRILRALEQLDTDEQRPALQIHQLQGQQAGIWTAYASKSLRITFRRLANGRKELVACSRHYGD
jgi:mRNA-degrading endonuclease YafQ of YafQ-DinJ toxin-antitoxin module